MSRYAIGLDMSLRSPGVAVHDLSRNFWYLAAFAQNKKQEGFVYETSKAKLTLFPQISKEATTIADDLKRYIHLQKYLVKFLCEIIAPEFRDAPFTQLNIEAYAFVDQTAHSEKLHEVCGILKYELYKQGFHCMQNIVNTSWKATIIGHGKASKLDTCKFMINNGPCLDFLKIFGYDEETLNVDDKGEKIVPSPVSDPCDACAIAMMIYTVKKFTSSKRKNEKDENETKEKEENNCIQEDPILILKNSKCLPMHKVHFKKRKQKKEPFDFEKFINS